MKIRHTDSLPNFAASLTSDYVLPDLPRHDEWRSLSGVILFDKPVGVTSNQALQWVRRLLCARKGGHTGTLDPFATGVLPLCLGEAAKFSADMLNANKCYEATLSFSEQTATGDLTGCVVSTTSTLPMVSRLEAILPSFLGEITQIPPMYSALKQAGQPLYRLARQGVEVERTPRRITIHSLLWLDFVTDDQGQVRTAKLAVCCSKGTYIRTLAEDIARAVDSLAHLTALRRTQVGTITLQQCLNAVELYSGITSMTKQGVATTVDALQVAGLMQPLDFLVQNLPVLNVSETQAVRCQHGNPFVAEPEQVSFADVQVRLYDQGRFLGVAEVIHDEKTLKIQPVRLVSAEHS